MSPTRLSFLKAGAAGFALTLTGQAWAAPTSTPTDAAGLVAKAISNARLVPYFSKWRAQYKTEAAAVILYLDAGARPVDAAVVTNEGMMLVADEDARRMLVDMNLPLPTAAPPVPTVLAGNIVVQTTALPAKVSGGWWLSGAYVSYPQ